MCRLHTIYMYEMRNMTLELSGATCTSWAETELLTHPFLPCMHDGSCGPIESTFEWGPVRLRTLPQMQYPGGWRSCNRSVHVHTALPFPSISQWDSILDGTVRVQCNLDVQTVVLLFKTWLLLWTYFRKVEAHQCSFSVIKKAATAHTWNHQEFLV